MHRLSALAALFALTLVLPPGCGSLESGPALLPELPPKAAVVRPKGQAVRLASVSANVLLTNREVGPILRFIEGRVGRRFELVYCRSYRDIVEAVEQRRCEFAWVSAQTYLSLRKVTGCEPVSQQVLNGRSYYRGLLVVGAASSIASVDALKGKRLALVDRSSTSGFAYPMAFFKARGIEPEKFFSSIAYTGTHESALMAVLRGMADAACIEEHLLERLAGKVDVAGVRSLAVTEEIPNGLIVAEKDVPKKLRDDVATALYDMDKVPEGRAIVEGLKASKDSTGFGPVTDQTYDEVRRVQTEAAALK